MAEHFVGYNVAIKLQDGQTVTGTVAAIDTAAQTLRLSNGASAAPWQFVGPSVLTDGLLPSRGVGTAEQRRFE